MEKGTKFLLGTLIVVIILLVVFGAFYLSQSRTSFFGKAAGTGQTYSLDNSYIFASPVTAKAGGGEKIKIAVFLLSPEGKGVAGKKIVLSSQPSLIISEVQGQTDSKGQAIFEVSSTTANRSIIQASVEGNVFPQSVTLTFN